MKVIVCVLALAASVLAVEVDPFLDAQCQEWVIANQKDLMVLNQVAASSHIASCQQFCMIAGAGFRSDTTTCRSLCDTAGGYAPFSKALTTSRGMAQPTDICATILKAKSLEAVEPVSFLETAPVGVVERKLGVRGDMTVQGTLVTSMLTSPIGDVKVSGEMNVLNEISANTARAAFLKSEAGISIKQGIVSKKDQLLIKGHIDADSVTAETFHASSFLELNGVRQWSLFSLEDFEEIEVQGWSDNEVSECAGRKMLGGHCVGETGKKEVTKTFTGLPEHTQVRINAQYMFIDSWDGESGFLKVNDNVVWTESYNHQGESKHGINVCGNETPERKFNRPIDVTIPHTGDSLTVTFGATTDEHPCDESFGIDSVMVFTR